MPVLAPHHRQFLVWIGVVVDVIEDETIIHALRVGVVETDVVDYTADIAAGDARLAIILLRLVVSSVECYGYRVQNADPDKVSGPRVLPYPKRKP